MKFQPATSLRPGTLWIGVAAVVLFAGEAARQAAWSLLAIATAAALALAVVAWLQQGPGERGLAVGLFLLATSSGIAAAMIGHTKYHAGSLQAEAVGRATATRDRLLRSSVDGARRAAIQALDRIGDAPASAEDNLADLVAKSEVESAIVVTGGDTVIAVAGPHRLQPAVRGAPVTLVTTPFARMLVLRETRHLRQAQVVLLLDSQPGLPVAGASLAAACGLGVLWNWSAALGSSEEFGSVDAAITGVTSAMTASGAPIEAFLEREAVTARIVVGIGLLLLALLLLLTASHPVARAGAILVPLWALARSDVGTTLFGLNAIRALLVAAALLLAAIALWRRSTNRAAPGVAGAALLLSAAPLLVVVVARQLLPHDVDLSLISGFGWEIIVALAIGAYLAIAIAPLRNRGDDAASTIWGLAATATAIVVALIGVEAWAPGTPPTPGGWPSWYPFLWLIPVACHLPATKPRARLVALATSAAVLATLATWATSLDRRVDLAAADLGRLNAESDSAAESALDRFARTARDNHATRLDQLYATWSASDLARDGVPSYLSLWSAEGHQREFVALDSLSVSWDELAPLVRRAGSEPQRYPLGGRVGHHEVLIVPLAPDTIATVTIGPRSRLLVPTTFGLLVGWRSGAINPPYTIEAPSSGSAAVDGRFRRRHRFVIADTVVTASAPRRLVRATVAILPPGPFLVRAALCVLLDVFVILGAWLLLRRLLGEPRAAPAQVFRRSYRRTVATALMAFFIVPVVAFTLVSVLRLQREAKRQHDAEVGVALRTVQDAGGLDEADSTRPSSRLLGEIADSANAEVGVYQRGRLVAGSDSMLAELGIMPPLIGRPAVTATGESEATLPSPLPAALLRLGVLAAPTPGAELVVVLPGGDTGLAAEQVDQSLVLLLAILAGIVASMLVAGAMARTLGQPIETLRRTAIAIGRHEETPPANDVPAEFVPVFGAIRQMEHDLRTTEAELQAGRARTGAILSTVATGVIGVDANGAVMHVNPRATELLGREIVLDRDLASQLPVGWERIAEGIERLLGRATRAPESRELQVGEQRMAVTLAPLGDGGLVLAITDITESSRAARVLAWGEMARQVAHEIKNPLTPMRLGLQHLRRVRADGSPDFPKLVDETAERLLVEIERLDRIARSFARYGAPPERSTALEPVLLRPVADEIASLFTLGSEQMAIEVVGDESAAVQARREELVQVLLNLLDNSRQAGATSVRLLLGGQALRIEDNGKGIPDDQLARIFEPAFSTNTSGTGLGLAIVRRLVEGWGGTISVESTPGSGTAFTLRFAPGG